MKTNPPIRLLTLATLLVLFPAAFVLSQGPLTPPGPPEPTMKTLQQIEPRIDLQKAPVSAVTTTNANYHYIITARGSYYLSANIDVTKPNGIQINAEGVTLDLMGFEISRVTGTGGNGIEIPATSDRATIRNGTIKGFSYGIRSLLSGKYARACAFRDLAVAGCTTYGIFAGEGAVLESCRAHDNSGSAGILASAGSTLSNCTASGNTATFGIDVTYSTLTNCTASENTGTYGISASAGSSLMNCSANQNTGTGSSAGISVGDGSSLTNCSAYGNTTNHAISAGPGCSLTNCSTRFNTGTYGIFGGTGCSLTNCSAYGNTSAAARSAGIAASDGSTLTHCSASATNTSAATHTATTGMGFDVFGTGNTIQNCTARSNRGDGIMVSDNCAVRENNCVANGNGLSDDGAGIHSTGTNNRIEGNNVTNNTRGIDVDSTASLIVKNTASDNTSNYAIAANNKVGVIVSAPNSPFINGATGGAGVGSTDPWANISY